MKKLFAILTTAGLIISLCGCGKEKVTEYTYTTTEFIMPELTLPTETTAPVIEPEAVDYQPTAEILDTDLFSNMLQINDKIYTLPITVGQLLNDGFEMTDDKSPEYLVDVDNRVNVKFCINDETLFLEANNWTSERRSLKDCIITDFEIQDENIFASKGLKIGMSMSEIENLLGKPYSDKSNGDIVYTYIDSPVDKQLLTGMGKAGDCETASGRKIYINFDRNTGLTNNIKIVGTAIFDGKTEIDDEINKGISYFNYNTCYTPPEGSYIYSGHYNYSGFGHLEYYNMSYAGLNKDSGYMYYFEVNNYMVIEDSYSELTEEFIKNNVITFKDNLEILEINDREAIVIASDNVEDNLQTYRLYCIENDMMIIFNFRIASFDEEQPLNDDNISSFKQIMLDFGRTVRYTPKD